MASQTHRAMNLRLAESKDSSMQSPAVPRDYRGLFVLKGHLPNGLNRNQNQGSSPGFYSVSQSVLDVTANRATANIYIESAECNSYLTV